MKYLLSLILLSTTLLSASAQLTLDKSYNHSCTSTMLNETDYKLFLMDDKLNQCRIYNTDHTLYKTISLSVPSKMYLYDVRYVTENLFNNDSKIELLYVYYQYVSTSNTEGYYKYYTRVINEDGQELVKHDNAIYSSIYKVDDDQYRLYIYTYDYSSFPYDTKTFIYKFSGYPYLLKSEEINAKSASLDNAYPNPAEAYTNIPYQLPHGMYDGQLKLFNIQGQQVASFPVDKNFNSIKLNTTSLQGGKYIYHIEAEGVRSESKSLIIK